MERQKLALKNFKIYWEERKYVYIYPYIINFNRKLDGIVKVPQAFIEFSAAVFYASAVRH